MLANVSLPHVPQATYDGKEEDVEELSADITSSTSETHGNERKSETQRNERKSETQRKEMEEEKNQKEALDTLVKAIEISSSKKQVVDALRKHATCSSDIYPIPRDQKRDLPLSTACALNVHETVISKLLEKFDDSLYEKDRDGWLPIQWAARCADVKVMEKLSIHAKTAKTENKISKPVLRSLMQIAVDHNLDNRLIEFLLKKNPASAYSSLSVVSRCLKIPSFFDKENHCEHLLDSCKDEHPLHACLLLSAGFMQCARNEESQNPEQAEKIREKADKIEQLAVAIAQYCCDLGPLKDKDHDEVWGKMDELVDLAAILKLKFFVSQPMFTSRIWRLWYHPKLLKGDYRDYATIGKMLKDYTPSARMLIASLLETFPGFSMFLVRKKRKYIAMQIILLIFLWGLWLYPLILTSSYSDSFRIVATSSVCALLLILPIVDEQIPACMRFTEHCASYLVFLTLASNLPVQIGPGDLQPREIILAYWLLDICFSELIQWYDICLKYSYSKKKGQSEFAAAIQRLFFGSWMYLSDPWNVYDFISLYTAMSAGLARVLVYAGYESSFFTARESNTLYAFAIALLWGRLVKILTIFTLTGPLLIMVFTMIFKDLMQFCFLVVLLELPFVSALSYLESVDGGNNDFATFGAASLSFFKVLIGNGAPEISTVSTYSAILYSIGTLLLVVLLLNLLVALFGKTFEKISKNSKSEYLLQMMKITHEWVRAPILPPPCTLALQIRDTLWSKCFKHPYCNSEDDSAVSSQSRTCFDGKHFKSIAGEIPEKEGEWRQNMLRNLEEKLKKLEEGRKI